MLALGIAACEAPRPFDPSVARRAVVGAETALARVDRPAAIRLAATRRAAELSDADRAPEAWSRAVAAAATALRARRRSELADRAAWDGIAPALAADLLRARDEARMPGIGRRETMALQRAEYLGALAVRLAADGEHRRAAAMADEVSRQTAILHESWLRTHARFQDPALRARWRAWAAETIAESRRSGRAAIVVDKLQRRLELFVGGEHRATYVAELGSNGLRDKRWSGDKATPEGKYRVTELRGRGATRYYKALMLDYPNAEDRREFRALQRAGLVPAGASPGSLIEVHGHGGSGRDWTDGCVALTDGDMDRLFPAVRVGTPVTIIGTR